MSSANLLETNQADSTLDHTTLHNVCMLRANLRDADLRGANLRNTNLEDSDLSNANMCWADLKESNLDKAKYISDLALAGAYLSPEINLEVLRQKNADLNGKKRISLTELADFFSDKNKEYAKKKKNTLQH